MQNTITLEVQRFQPEHDATPSYRSYETPLHKDWVILDALNYIKDQIDGTLTFRWSCRMGVCGSCGMMVNGKPVLTCATFLTKYAPGPIRIAPMENFAVVRDLVIDMSEFIGKLARVKPWLIPGEDKSVADGEYLQTPEQLADYKQYSMCINCLLCYSACPIVGLEPGFLGPAAIALAQRYNMDNRDAGEAQRTAVLAEDDGIYECTFVGECSTVCPKSVDPAGAIQRYKLSTAIGSWKSLLLPWGRP